MQRFWSFLTNSRTLSVIGIVALAAFLFVGASTLELALVWSGVLIGVFLFVWLAVWLFKRWRARQAAQGLEQVIEQQAERAAKAAPPVSGSRSKRCACACAKRSRRSRPPSSARPRALPRSTRCRGTW